MRASYSLSNMRESRSISMAIIEKLFGLPILLLYSKEFFLCCFAFCFFFFFWFLFFAFV
jgi:hypothetical protein